MRNLTAILICTSWAFTAFARTITVDDIGPSDFDKIQAAIDNANNGDTVIVMPGTYTGVGNRNIDFRGKAVTIVSNAGPDVTVLDCQNSDRGFYFHSGENSASVLDGFTVTNGFALDGGGVLCNNSSPLIKNCKFINCYAENWGGGIYCYLASSPIISDCNFIGNSAFEGGAITTRSNWGITCAPLIKNCFISSNTCLGSGGGINSDCLSTPTISNCVVTGNSAGTYGGGGISIYQSNPTITNCLITGNSTDNGGGGILCWYPDDMETRPVIENCTVAENIAANYGGGIYCDNSCNVIIADCNIRDNRVTIGEIEAIGGGIYCGTANATIKRCSIKNNRAEGEIGLGAGVCGSYHDEGTLTIENCLISENQAEGTIGGAGGGVSRCNGPISNCTITNNVAIDYGGGLSDCQGITNCIIWGNYASWEPQLEEYAEPNYSCIELWSGGGNGNIDLEPMFEADGYHIGPNSPCINAGDPTGDYSEQNDIDGESRVLGGRVDIGADEFTVQPTPLIGISSTVFEFDANEGGANPDTQILGIANTGVGTLNWEVLEDCPWLEAIPPNGESTGEVDEVVLSVDISGLTEDVYHCILTISDPCAFNSPQTVDITLVVRGPIIELSTNLVEFFAEEGGTNPPDQVFTIRNSGGLTLDWQIAHESDWLSIEPCLGSSSGETDEVTLRADITGLIPSHPVCELTVSSDQASNSPQTVEVVLHVEGDFRVPEDYPTIQAAIDAAMDGDVVIVSEGIHRGAGNRDLDLRGKAIIVQSANPDDPCVVENTIIDCQGSVENPHRGFRINAGEGRDSVVSGFTITNGYAPAENHGGGMISIGGAIWCRSADPTIEKCRIVNNTAGDIGGGIYGWDSDFVIRQCEISNNSAGLFGGGILVWVGRPEIINCDVANNSGGGIYIVGCWDPLVSGCSILGNIRIQRGGGIYTNANHDSITIRNCVIAGNSANGGGGILVDRDYVSASITNCTISGNSAVYYGGGVYEYSVSPPPNLKDCILWGNTAPNEPQLAGQILISYSDIQGGYSGTGNINVDPLFYDPDNFDYHLLPDSNCIDAGNPTSDWSNEPSPNGARVNIGAYGNTSEATRSRAGLQLVGFNVISKTRIGRTIFRYILSLSLANITLSDIADVTVKLIDADEQVVNVIDDEIFFSLIAAESTSDSDIYGDYFTIDVDRSALITAGRLTWQVDYTEIEGSSSRQMMSLGLPAALGEDGIVGDITGEGDVDIADLTRLAEKWLWTGTPDSIDEDIAPQSDGDGIVNFLDFAVLAENWLK